MFAQHPGNQGKEGGDKGEQKNKKRKREKGMENHIAAKSDDTNVLCWCGSEKWRGTWSNLTDQGTICPLQPNERYKSGATHPFRANMNILTGSERAVTALQGQELFNDF